MTLEKFLSLHKTPAFKTKIIERLEILRGNQTPGSNGPNVLVAIETEDSLNQTEWEKFCSKIIEVKKGDLNHLLQAIMMACREIATNSISFNWNGCSAVYCELRGLPIPLLKDHLMCKVFPFQEMVDRIQRVHAIAAHSEADRVIADQLEKAPQTVIGPTSSYREVPIGNFFNWATFNPKSSRSAPFPFQPTVKKQSRNQIAGTLGLPKNMIHKKGGLIALCYNLPLSTIPRKPSIAHAYAGPSWNYYFRPNSTRNRKGVQKKWGLTVPWEGCKNPPQPEVVHELVSLGDCSLDYAPVIF